MNCKAAPIESVISDTDRSSIFFFQKNKGLAARFRRASYFFYKLSMEVSYSWGEACCKFAVGFDTSTKKIYEKDKWCYILMVKS